MRKGLLKKLAQLSRLRNPTPGYLQAGEPEKLAAWLSPSVKASQPDMHLAQELGRSCRRAWQELQELGAHVQPVPPAESAGHSNGTLAKCCSLDLGLPGLCNANAAYATHRFYPADMDCVVGRTLTGSSVCSNNEIKQYDEFRCGVNEVSGLHQILKKFGRSRCPCT
ncbi:PREDICTED: uncharacterized protein LOC105597516 isoform X3 [Cercocebus atys]|uniref:uncharacterized protein LOC105597516 isoform X3 n=1 Tax=Cercocebus atys TaxID=9531 RepID=UPI0005F37E34|nr:PREDICTED: uncharacterized protein LOC105597516 isoform X3 [Cercocebus atys]XP_011941241.1 PREDICTED: uncharacterized protein LOC105597516 isoform X3 [Cercocebus atys]XP_011941242.1 PREDICTED: uncharacterized protein LOC105597516 isoform X3 [Cercocebus atys]